MERRFFSISEIALYLGFDRTTVQRKVDRGELPAVKIGRSVRIDLKKLNELLESKQIKD